MKLQGSLDVKSIVKAGLRVNESLDYVVLLQDLELTKYCKKHLYYKTEQDFAITLPDATTIQPGWRVLIANDSASTGILTINQKDDTVLSTIKPNLMVEFILVSNETASGVWDTINVGGAGVTFRVWE